MSVRKAAERLLDEGFGTVDRPLWVAKAVAQIARAYLQEHPADDDEPIDEAWLRSHPALKRDERYQTPVFNIGTSWLGVRQDGGQWEVFLFCTGYRVLLVTTRRQLRNLLAALGVGGAK